MHESQTLGMRLKIARDHLGYAQKGMAEAAGSKLRSWQDYEADKKVPGSQIIAGLSALGVNANWLLLGEGPMLRNEQSPDEAAQEDAVLSALGDPEAEERAEARARAHIGQIEENKSLVDESLKNAGVSLAGHWRAMLASLTRKYSISAEHLKDVSAMLSDCQALHDEFAYIPLYDAEVSAGHGSTMEDATVLSHLAFRKDSLRNAGLNPSNLSAVQVSGDSMLGVVSDGDTVLVDHSRRDINREGLYVLRLDDHLYVKHLQKTLDGVNIISANKVYSTLSVPRDRIDDLEVIGRAVWAASWLD